MRSGLKKNVQNTLLVLGSVIVTLLIAEGLVRLIIPQDRMVTWIEMHPRGFVMNQPGGKSFQEFNDRRAEYRFISERLRGNSPDPDRQKILAIGDSFTFGLLLDEEETYVHKLENTLQSLDYNYQILNGAVGGAGLADWPLWLEEYGKGVAPDKVLYFLNIHDVDRALSKNLFVIDTETEGLIPSQRWEPNEFLFRMNRTATLRWLQTHSVLANRLISQLWKTVYFADVTDNFNPETSSVPIPEIEKLYVESDYSLQLSRLLFERMDNWCRENGCELIVATTGFFVNDADVSPHTEKLYNSILESGITEGVPFLDITPCVEEITGGDINSVRIPGDSHPNEEGAAMIADCLTNELLPYLN